MAYMAYRTTSCGISTRMKSLETHSLDILPDSNSPLHFALYRHHPSFRLGIVSVNFQVLELCAEGNSNHVSDTHDKLLILLMLC
jgi:hypothetical protein